MARCQSFYKSHKTRHWNTYKEKKYAKSYTIQPNENLSHEEDTKSTECLSAFKCIMKGKQTSGAHKPCKILLNQLNSKPNTNN
jgi:hypothetical protein